MLIMQSTDELLDAINTAYDAVKKSNVKEDALQLEAFRFALDALIAQSSKAGTGEDKTSIGQSSISTIATGDPISEIARALGVDGESAELIYDIRDGVMYLNLPTKALPDSASGAMREIAVLLSVGRKYAKLGASTPYDLIRSVCDEHGRLDKKNFAAAMNSLRPRLVSTGKGPNKDLAPKRPADDLAKEYLLRYATLN
jgi:hypothetical protein